MNFNSQCGEDKYLFDNGYLSAPGFYIDLGSADGTINSNTKILDLLGWVGICVEPNPVYLGSYKERICNLIKKAVTTYEGVVKFDFHPIGEIGCISEEGQDVECTTLSNIVRQNNVTQIDLLTIDLEGHEYDVLNGYFTTDLPKPKIIITEFDTLGKQDHRALHLLIEHGYRVIKTTYYNYILVK